MWTLSMLTSFLCRIKKPTSYQGGLADPCHSFWDRRLNGSLPPLPRYPGDALWGHRHQAKRSSIVDTPYVHLGIARYLFNTTCKTRWGDFLGEIGAKLFQLVTMSIWNIITEEVTSIETSFTCFYAHLSLDTIGEHGLVLWLKIGVIS
jgi:hypothetical protein